jgi:hypothetical protein
MAVAERPELAGYAGYAGYVVTAVCTCNVYTPYQLHKRAVHQ